MKGELERTMQEAATAYIMALSWHFPERTDRNHDNLCRNNLQLS
jgi:hypothetical protein